ncbi:hypothetical protein WBP06_18260 (plasmid) [Novosphingobium sp. BL-8H]|uniref:hypothetical protein n=1 Tax=Novosphingobium sp. BL-8H TaxID=3127640 RepID=UPI0037571848
MSQKAIELILSSLSRARNVESIAMPKPSLYFIAVTFVVAFGIEGDEAQPHRARRAAAT